MRLPRSGVVNGKRWRVVRKHLSRRGLSGQCVHRSREIQIDEDLPVEEIGEVFLHELMHACLPERFSSAVEERIVLRMAPRLLNTLKGIGWVK